MSSVRLEVFSDVVCPWCYIGKTKLGPAVEEFQATGGEVEPRYRPYLLNAEFTGPSRPMSDYLAERFGPRAAQLSAGVTAAAAELGLRLDLAAAVAADSRPAHQLIEAAYRTGGYPAQREVADQLFQAHFSRGEDIADRSVLATVLDRSGLDRAVLSTALDDAAVAESVARDLSEAAQLGITAVPTFVANRAIGVQGAQPSETLLEFLRQAANQPVSA